jgi:hypothetical protein
LQAALNPAAPDRICWNQLSAAAPSQIPKETSMPSARLVSALLLTACIPATASAVVHIDSRRCEIDSPYSVQFGEQRLRFERKAKGEQPAQLIEIGNGVLRLDGRELQVGEADRQRLQEFESQARALVPEAKALALDAIDIAFRALQQVGVSFAGEDPASRERIGEKLATTRLLLSRRIEDGFNGKETLGSEQIDDLIGESITALLPTLAGEIAAIAVRAALSGDEAAARDLEARAARLEKTLEAEMEARAGELEARGEALCERARELDRIESTLSSDLLDGRPLDLVQVTRN